MNENLPLSSDATVQPIITPLHDRGTAGVAVPPPRRGYTLLTLAALLPGIWFGSGASTTGADAALAQQAQETMRKAATFYRTKVATHGGYVYFYSADLKQRFGEGKATADQIWVQPPGTPTVGLAYLKAFEATGDRFYLDAARETAQALVHGQLKSGGWINCIDFDPEGKRVTLYRNGKGRGRNVSTLDDGTTQSALRFLMRTDRALQFKDAQIHEAGEVARTALYQAQFANGAFPQIWVGPVPSVKPMKAQYPDYDWRTEGRVKNYWDMFTLNDDLAGDVADTLLAAWEIYHDEAARRALVKLGDFLLLAQMPEPQPAWAQQYDYEMHPIWARKFEPPGISPRESQDVLETLLKIHRFTGDAKYLEPIPRALTYLKECLLPDGQHARYYELRTNRPLYMTRGYKLTYSDADVPQHYGFKTRSRLDAIEREFNAAKAGKSMKAGRSSAELEREARRITSELDAGGRWVSQGTGERLIGQNRFPAGTTYISSERFSRNLETLSEYLMAAKRSR